MHKTPASRVDPTFNMILSFCELCNHEAQGIGRCHKKMNAAMDASRAPLGMEPIYRPAERILSRPSAYTFMRKRNRKSLTESKIFFIQRKGGTW